MGFNSGFKDINDGRQVLEPRTGIGVIYKASCNKGMSCDIYTCPVREPGWLIFRSAISRRQNWCSEWLMRTLHIDQ